MKRRLHLIILSGLLLTVLAAGAQESTPRQIYNQAESDFGIGRIEQAKNLLQDNLSLFEGNLKQSAYRLLALCYLYQDCDEEAKYYAEKLVKLNNYYNSADDPPRFQDLVSRLKGGITTTITIASSQSETINEAPAPITIITTEMIEELGYNKNLGQILAAYVPGMAEISSLDESANMSMHGAYANKQELILIMENGHRLNTRYDNSIPTSYSISTEKIDHIEVLRGPASSLYGNVALSAVVNIITKSGKTLNGLKAKYGHATYDTHKADLTIGTQFMDADIFAWASIYNSDGQIRPYDENIPIDHLYVTYEDYGGATWSTIGTNKKYVGAYKDTPAYDVGFTFKLNGFDVMFSRKNVKKVFQHTMYYGGYSYDKYPIINGVKPGIGMVDTHAEIGYTQRFKHFYLNGSLYSDWYTVSNYEVSFDSVFSSVPVMDNDSYVMDENGNVMYEEERQPGYVSYLQFREHTMGGFVRGGSDYLLGNMKGSLLAGCQYEHFSLLSETSIGGPSPGGDVIVNYGEKYVIDAGKESSLSFFIQDKHYLLPQLILNAGFRYDLKYRERDNINSFSPRLALLYVPNDRFSLKLSYSEAFADLSFYYRFISNIQTEDYNTNPQHLSAVQLTTMGIISPLHLNYEVNLFYNRYNNLLLWVPREIYPEKNVGQLTNIGIEGTASYAYKRLSAYLSIYYCHDTSSKMYYYNSKEKIVNNVPHFTFNLHGAWKILEQMNHLLKFYGHASYTGRKLNYEQHPENDYYLDGKLLLDLGIQYRFRQHLQFSLDCENIFNTDHYICGPSATYITMIERGRSLMASVSYQF